MTSRASPTPNDDEQPEPLRRVGRYFLFDEVGHGGTASVHVGRWVSPGGFSKTVAVKHLHQNVARDAEVQAMFLDEARLVSRIRHANVVAMLDFLALAGETFLIMEYVHGASLAALNRTLWAQGEKTPLDVALRISSDALAGLAAAHAATTEAGEPLGLVHRDVSPHNLQVGVDGVCRILDFGIAKALGRVQDTHTGQLKGKLAYMAPEQLLGEPVDQRADLFAAGVVLWETLAGQRLFAGEAPGHTVKRILLDAAPPLERLARNAPPELCAIVERAVHRDPAQRFQTALQMLDALEGAGQLASSHQVGAWLTHVGGAPLAARSERLRRIESLALVVPKTGSSSPSAAPSLGARPSRAEEHTRTDVRGTFPSFSDLVAPEPVGRTETEGLERAPLEAQAKTRKTRTLRWLSGALGVGAVLATAGALLLRPSRPSEARSVASETAVDLPLEEPFAATAVVPVPPQEPALPRARTPQHKPAASVHRPLPRAEDLFSRH